MDFLQALQGRLIFDGGFGTMLQQAGLPAGAIPDLWNMTHPEAVKNIHLQYLQAGAQVITANTFGSNRSKLAGTGFDAAQVAAEGVRLAKQAIRESGQTAWAAVDLGSTGRLLRPLGDLDFEEAVSLFGECAAAGEAAGADLVLIETVSDSYELKAAVLAAKEYTHLPVLATVTMDEGGKLLTGGDVESVAALLEGLRVDGMGLNCGLGPKQLLPFVRRLLACTDLPVLLNPNAGMPRSVDGKTVFDVTPQEYAACMEEAAKLGVNGLGGCCGTNPDYIRLVAQRCGGLPVHRTPARKTTRITSYTHAVTFDDGPILIGERINPTGKSKLKAALREENYDYILNEAVRQQEAGVHALDVNAGLPDIDEPKVLTRLVQEIQAVCDLPLQLDSSDPAALSRAMRIYNGKAMINSVNGKRESMEAVFPLVRKYGGVVVGLTLDESGIPETAAGRLAIARRIVDTAASYGIEKQDIVIDPLTLTVSAQPDAGRVTLESVRLIRQELGVRTSLGVSNVSFGLPRRDILNGAFFTAAIAMGLDAAILNPHTPAMRDAYFASRALLGRDPDCGAFIAAYADTAAPDAAQKTGTAQPSQAADGKPEQGQTIESRLEQAVKKGLKEQAVLCTRQALADHTPMALIDGALIPALNQVGEQYESGKLFLPQLLMCAEAAKAAFAALQEAMAGTEAEKPIGTVVLATVQGDIHDIGKNIVKALLENYRFRILDLGRDVAPERILEAVRENDVRLAGLSALMTTTVPAMAETVRLLREQAPQCRVMVGGAVLSADIAAQIGATQYVKDAMASVRYAQQVLDNKGEAN